MTLGTHHILQQVQLSMLRGGELKHEIHGESGGFSLDLLVEPARRYAIKLGQIGIEHDPLASNHEDSIDDVFESKRLRHPGCDSALRTRLSTCAAALPSAKFEQSAQFLF